MTIPYTFAGATTAIPLAQLDANFASPITLGNVAMTLSNTYTSIGNLTLTNVTVSSGNVTTTSISATSVTDSGLTSGRITYAGTGGLLQDSANLTVGGSGQLVINAASGQGTPLYLTTTDSGANTQVIFAGNRIYQIGTGNSGSGFSNSLYFYDGTAGAERMRIDSSGNLLVGTTANTTGAKINIATDGSAQNRILSFTNTQSGGQTYQFLNGNGNQFTLYNSTINTAMWESRPTGNGTTFALGQSAPSVRANDVSLFIGSGGGQNIALNPGDYSLGLNYYLGSGPYNYTTSYYASKISFYAGQISTGTASSGTAGNAITFTAGPYVAVGGTSWTNSSDENLKEITGIVENALDKISQVRAARFTWKADKDSKPQVGLIAQDLQKVLPEVVVVPTEKTDQEGNPTYLGVNYDQVIPLLLAGIQELNAKVDALEAQLGVK